MSNGCACKATDPYDCWALRYHHTVGVPGMMIDLEGGPCQCACHEEDAEECPMCGQSGSHNHDL